MTTKVEQLVMGAFWEAAYAFHAQDGYHRHTLEETEEKLAQHMAFLIRTNGLRNYQHDLKTAQLSKRIREAAERMEHLAAGWRDYKRDKPDEENPIAERAEEDARQIRLLLDGLEL